MVAAVAVPELSARGLICDPDPVVAESLARQLCRSGYPVAIAADGIVALEIALRLRPTFVLVSLELPVLDGWDVARTFSRVATFGAPRLIALSTRKDDVSRDSLARVGFASCLSKPVTASEVTALLDLRTSVRR